MKTIKNISKLALFFTIISSAFAVKAQTRSVNYIWDNQSGCDWQIYIYNNATPSVENIVAGTSAPAYTGVGTVPSSGCLSILNSAPLSIKLVDPGCGCELSFSLPLGGTNSSVTSDCAAQGCSQCHPSNPTTQISVLPISPSLTCDEKYTIVIQ